MANLLHGLRTFDPESFEREGITCPQYAIGATVSNFKIVFEVGTTSSEQSERQVDQGRLAEARLESRLENHETGS